MTEGLNIRVDTADPEMLKGPSERPPIESGIYKFRVGSINLEQSKSSSSKIVPLILSCLTPGFEGHKVFDNLVVLDSCKWKIAQFAKACGVESANKALNLSLCADHELFAQISIDSYTDAKGKPKMRNVVDKYLWGDEAQEAAKAVAPAMPTT